MRFWLLPMLKEKCYWKDCQENKLFFGDQNESINIIVSALGNAPLSVCMVQGTKMKSHYV